MNKDPDRAKQFLAFAALSGFERLLEEREAAAEQKENPKKPSRPQELAQLLPDDEI